LAGARPLKPLAPIVTSNLRKRMNSTAQAIRDINQTEDSKDSAHAGTSSSGAGASKSPAISPRAPPGPTLAAVNIASQNFRKKLEEHKKALEQSGNMK